MKSKKSNKLLRLYTQKFVGEILNLSVIGNLKKSNIKYNKVNKNYYYTIFNKKQPLVLFPCYVCTCL